MENKKDQSPSRGQNPVTLAPLPLQLSARLLQKLQTSPNPPPSNYSSLPSHDLYPLPPLPKRKTMALLPTSLSPSRTQPTPPAPSPDGAFEAPDRRTRAVCWQARDDFFACLSRNGIVDGIKEKERAESVCGAEGKVFERECAPSWVGVSFFGC